MKTITLTAALAATLFILQQGTARADVTVNLIGETLFIDGDPGDNLLYVDGDASNLTVSETFGGAPIASVPSEAVAEVVITTGGGQDQLTITGTIPGDLWISTGAGFDPVYLSGTTILGDLTINTGQETDRVYMFNVFVAGNTDVSTGQGIDDVTFAPNATFVGDLHVNTGVNNDFVFIHSFMAVGGNLVFEFGQGDDKLSLDDTYFYWEFIAEVGGNARIFGDQGNNQIISQSGLPIEMKIDVSGDLEVTGFEP